MMPGADDSTAKNPDELIERIHAVFGGSSRLDVDTNYFEGGFNSAALAALLPRLRALGLELTLIDLFRYPTVRALASRRATPGHAPGTTPPWAQAGSRGEFPGREMSRPEPQDRREHGPESLPR